MNIPANIKEILRDKINKLVDDILQNYIFCTDDEVSTMNKYLDLCDRLFLITPDMYSNVISLSMITENGVNKVKYKYINSLSEITEKVVPLSEVMKDKRILESQNTRRVRRY